jgi:hypothetical protein
MMHASGRDIGLNRPGGWRRWSGRPRLIQVAALTATCPGRPPEGIVRPAIQKCAKLVLLVTREPHGEGEPLATRHQLNLRGCQHY